MNCQCNAHESIAKWPVNQLTSKVWRLPLASSSKVGRPEVASGTTGQPKERARPLSLHPVCTRLAYLVYTPYTHISRWGCCTSVPASIESCQDPCCPLDEWPLDPLDLAISCAVNFCSITIIIFNVCSGPIHSPRFAWLSEIFTDFSPEFFLGVLPVGEPHLIQ